MSIRSVTNTIKNVTADGYLTRQEAEKVVQTAEKGPVTVGEMKAVTELFERAIKQPGQMGTTAIPENPGDVMGERAAKPVLEGFFARHGVPAGEQRAVFKERIEATFAKHGALPMLDFPPDTKKLFSFDLTPEGLQDVVLTAWIDPVAEKLYHSTSGMGPDGMMAVWSGPVDLEKADDHAQAKAAIETAFAAAFPSSDGGHTWREIGEGSLKVGDQVGTGLPFTLTSKSMANGVAGPGETGRQELSGSYNPETGAVTFDANFTKPEVKRAISDALRAQFPPQQSRSLTLDLATLAVSGAPEQGKAAFTFDADVSIGGIAGPVGGGKASFVGEYTVATGKVDIREKYNPNVVVGMSKADAVRELESKGFSTRVVSLDGVPQAVTADIRNDRVGLSIDNGIVTGAETG